MAVSRVRRALVTALLVPSLAVVPACSIFVPTRQNLTIVPSEETADVYVNGKHVGTGTTTVRVKRGADYSVMAKAGDRAATGKVGRKISGTGVADLVGGFVFLFPFIGVFSSGFWELNPNQIAIALPPGATYSSPAYAPAPQAYRPPAAPAQAAPAPAVTQRPANANGNRAPASSGSRLPPRRAEAR